MDWLILTKLDRAIHFTMCSFEKACFLSVQHKVMVTAGANQAFVNLVLALLDPQDAVVLFAPYYFNHMMAIQVISELSHVFPAHFCFPGL